MENADIALPLQTRTPLPLSIILQPLSSSKHGEAVVRDVRVLGLP
jgi:hypothetical protein